jgi:hypothetical protein
MNRGFSDNQRQQSNLVSGNGASRTANTLLAFKRGSRVIDFCCLSRDNTHIP